MTTGPARALLRRLGQYLVGSVLLALDILVMLIFMRSRGAV